MARGKKPVQIKIRNHRMIRLIQRHREDKSGTPGQYSTTYTLGAIVEDLIEREIKALKIAVPA